MKHYAKHLVTVVTVLAAVVFITCTAKAKDTIEASIAGTWIATGTWEGYGTWEETWIIQQGGFRIYISSDEYPNYFLNGVTFGPVVVFKIGSGCFPIYSGTLKGDTLQGKMKCTNSNDRGTWSATRMVMPPPQEIPYENESTAAGE
jgi:hypothetical protein